MAEAYWKTVYQVVFEDDAQDAWALLRSYAREQYGLEFSNYMQANSSLDLGDTPEIIMHADMPDEWTRRYQENGYILHDLAARHVEHSFEAYEFNAPLKFAQPTALSKLVSDEAKEFGIVSGVVARLPDDDCLYRQGVTFTGSAPIQQFTRVFQQASAELVSLSYLYHAKMSRARRQTRTLSTRQRECLTWAAVGKTEIEISDIIGVSHRTVKFHLSEAARRLTARSRAHAVALAIINKEIDI